MSLESYLYRLTHTADYMANGKRKKDRRRLKLEQHPERRESDRRTPIVSSIKMR